MLRRILWGKHRLFYMCKRSRTKLHFRMLQIQSSGEGMWERCPCQGLLEAVFGSCATMYYGNQALGWEPLRRCRRARAQSASCGAVWQLGGGPLPEGWARMTTTTRKSGGATARQILRHVRPTGRRRNRGCGMCRATRSMSAERRRPSSIFFRIFRGMLMYS